MAMRYWDTYAAVYVIEGSGRFEDQDGLRIPLREGNLMLMFPRHGYRYLSRRGEPWSEFFIQFEGPVFDLWVQEGLLDPKSPVHRLENVEHWWHRLEAIIKPSIMPEPVQTVKRICLLQEFLADTVLSPQAPAAAADTLWLATAQSELEKNLEEAVNWDAVARSLGISYNRFRQKFAALGGVPPAAYRAGKVIAHAEDLLRDQNLSVKEIALRCGFHDEFHFSKRFKDLTGLTPAQFRRRLLGSGG